MDGRSDLRWLMAHDRAELLVLLRSLTPAEWERTTAAAPWVVRDVVAHILGDDVSRLARDGSALTIATEVGTWSWVRGEAGWRRSPTVPGGAVLTIDADVLWRVCVRMVQPDDARSRARVDGAVASAVLEMVSIIR